MLFGLEMVALTKRKETVLKMLRFSLRVMRTDRIKKEHIRGTAQV